MILSLADLWFGSAPPTPHRALINAGPPSAADFWAALTKTDSFFFPFISSGI